MNYPITNSRTRTIGLNKGLLLIVEAMLGRKRNIVRHYKATARLIEHICHKSLEHKEGALKYVQVFSSIGIKFSQFQIVKLKSVSEKGWSYATKPSISNNRYFSLYFPFQFSKMQSAEKGLAKKQSLFL